MAISAYPILVNPSDDWVQIAATNPAASSLNFTGISNYKKLMVFWANGTNTITSFRFNSDSGTKYAYSSIGVSSGTPVGTYNYTTTAVQTNADNYMRLEIESADTSNIKKYSCEPHGSSQTYRLTGIYQATAPITSVNLVWSGTFSQTVYLYGVRA